ncbi:hypothetical protein [Microbacterium sp. W4I20]|uniref:hypothetical protein n=1 Tax=Microbacterium sp. W4I20 TaxID=3042262 RepID=UPI002783E618|nr:hypothetical protein [Microbacterium sp. W4I20]MDQ0726833.1 hypothetical protein [Microbacterium sp. W4I20]
MTWFKVDDGFWSHPKTATLSDAAVTLWVRAGAYSCQHLTDGVIKRPVLRLVGDVDAAAELVDCNLWITTKDGWRFHDWDEYQETSETVKKRRDDARERQKKAREARENKRAMSQGSSRVTDGVTNAVSSLPPTRPDPTRPDLLKKKNIAHPTDAPSTQMINRMFDTFWQAWPVKKGKEPARKSFIKAIKAGADMAAIMAGVEAYKAELGSLMGGKTIDGRTPKYAQGWLTDKRWTDEPSTASVMDINAQWDAAMGETKNPCANGHKWAADDSCVRCLQLKNEGER